MSETTSQKSDRADDMAESVFAHGTMERKTSFIHFFTHCINTPGCPELNATATFELLAIAALEWPGEENEEWATLVGLASYFFREAVRNGEINPKRILENIGKA